MLGKNILKFRKQKGLSQEELAEKIDVTRQTISNWELGETTPNPDQLKKLSKEFNISIDELLDNEIKNVIVEKVSNTEKLSGTILYLMKFFLLMFVIGIGIVLFYVIMNVVVHKDTGFSKQGVINLLVFEGYDETISKKVVEEADFDYYEQALYDACFSRFTSKNYSGSYSREHAEDSLKYDEFTNEEIKFALTEVYDKMDDIGN